MVNYIKYYYLQLKGFWTFKRRVGVFGDFVVVNPRNVKIGEFCGINHGVFILGACNTVIGNNVVLSANVMLIDSGLDVENFTKVEFPRHVSSEINIEDGAWIGAAAIILPGVTVGAKSIVGAGSVVTKNVPPFAVVAGNPARVIKMLSSSSS